MFTVTLLSSPARPALDPALVEALRNAWGGGTALWLAPDEAAEFEVERVPDTGTDTAAELRGLGVDLAVQPTRGRRKRLLLADMDSTMIGQECIDELADAAGVGAGVAEITARAMNGELDFEGALRERLALLRGRPAGLVDEVLRDRIRPAAGAEVAIATLRAKGCHCALVSGGFTAFTEAVAARLGFDEHRANVLGIRDGKLTGEAVEPILGREAKVLALQEISARLEIGPEAAVAVGDGANDLGMLQAAGCGVALHAKPVVAAQAPVRIDNGDLTALLYLQGIARDEFVTP